MRILFVVNRLAHVRHFDRAVRLLADRGHDVCLASQDDDVELWGVLARQPRIRAMVAPRNRGDDWGAAATMVRRTRDYIRYLHPRYAAAKLLRERAFEKMVGAVSDSAETVAAEWSELLLKVPKTDQKRLDVLLAKLETAIPNDPDIDEFLTAQRPDALVLSPLVGIGFTQADFVKSARALGIPSSMLVFSWDNLSNKGLIHDMPDRVLVWNDVQLREAVKLHKCPEDRIVITGASRFDEFFEMQPASTRTEFCRLAGLDPTRPIVTYLGSSKFVAATEQAFVSRWIAELRRSRDAVLAGCNLLIRPHPAGEKNWHADDAVDIRWPKVGEKATVSRPFGDDRAIVMNSPMQNADVVLYDSLFHSAAIVGLNTSAEIEAAIVGRPVFTILDSNAKGQQGTLHFHYLLRERGGHVELAESFDQHTAQLSDALAGRYSRDAIVAFVQRFVRPHGLEVQSLRVWPMRSRRSPPLTRARTTARQRRLSSDDGDESGPMRAVQPMRILFHVTLTTMLRHFESVLLELANRGHMIRIASHRSSEIAPPAALVAHPRIAFVTSPGRRGDEWSTPIHELRALRDYIRFLDRRFKPATKLRARALRTAVKAVTHDERAHLVHRCPKCDARLVDDDVGQMLRGFGKQGVKNLDTLLALMERTIPSATAIEDFLKAEQPDLVLVSPLVNLGSYQADFVKSAKALHIPVVYPVFSWDNLSTKGLIHVQPDGVIVWNERQRTEALEMHGVSPERVAVTGAPRFDDFFAMSPATTRDQFCGIHRLDARHPIVVYLCSSEFVAGGEVDFVRRWIDEVRREPSLRSCNILIRPHPRQQKPWKGFAAADARVAVALPKAMNADPTLFDTVHHSAAVVGLNTSAQLEAGILGRPVLTILAPEFEAGQQGTLHFSYLLKEHGGFVDVAPDFDTHRRQLAAAVKGDYDPRAIRTFIEMFLRPRGIDRPATPVMVQAIEEFAHSLGRDRPEVAPGVTIMPGEPRVT